MAPHRHRPLVKIILSNAPSGTGTDEWRTKLINVNNSTPHLEQAILDHLTELVSGFLEARYSMNCIGNDDFVVVQLSDALVDCTPNERGEESRFNCIGEYVSPPSLDELAMRLMSTFEVDVTVVFGDKISLLFRKAPSAQ
jgi:hypothetical protein